MYSIISLYKIGHGPSSSHTMGPSNAARYFLNKHPNATTFKVILYGSLALTGKGHLTDVAIQKVLVGKKITIVWDTKTKVEHPNTMDFFAYLNEKEIGKIRIYSIGGGAIRLQNEKSLVNKNIYPQKSSTSILKICSQKKWTLVDYVLNYEHQESLINHLKKIWDVMQSAIESGLNTEGILPGKLQLMRRAKKVFNWKPSDKMVVPNYAKTIKTMAYAYAVAETNAGGGVVVTAPTCGACGILPAVLAFAKKESNLNDKKIYEALMVAGLIGNLARTNASISGAEAGCQAEVGVACSMGAAAYACLGGADNFQIFHASSIALEHHLGLTCDPVMGYVQAPCIERNALASIRSIHAASLALALERDKNIFNYDDILEVMKITGQKMNRAFRETSKGGLAKYYSSKNHC